MRESCTYGSVRGAQGNLRPYRDQSEIRISGTCAAVSRCAQHRLRPFRAPGLSRATPDPGISTRLPRVRRPADP